MAEEWGYKDKTTGESSQYWSKSSGVLALLYKHRKCLYELDSELGGFDFNVAGVGVEAIEWLVEKEGHDIILCSDCGNELELKDYS